MIKLLIVDDDQNIRDGLQKLIPWDELGICIIGSARNGLEAIEWIERDVPHILMTDIRMPNMDGLQLIECIRDRNQSMRIVVLSGYDDYDFVRKAMKFHVEDYLLKPITEAELVEILKTICTQLKSDWKNEQLKRESFQLLRNNMLIRWVEDRIDITRLWDKMDFFNMPILLYKVFQVAIITWNDIQESSIPPEELQFRSFSIHNVVEESMHRTDSRSVSLSYREAIELLDYVHLTGSATCIDTSWIQEKADNKPPSFDDPIRFMQNLLCERGSWIQQLNDDIDWALSQKNPLNSARAIAAEWILHLRQTVKKTNHDANNPLKEPYVIQNLFTLHNIQDIRQSLHDLIDKLELFIRIQAEGPEHSLIKQVEQYISENVTEDLSLKVLSYKFEMNSSYLGKLFKDNTGEFFSDYVHRIRLEKAKKLLSESHIKVSEIGKHIGFGDPNYFFRKFKQLTGISPTEYRKGILKGL